MLWRGCGDRWPRSIPPKISPPFKKKLIAPPLHSNLHEKQKRTISKVNCVKNIKQKVMFRLYKKLTCKKRYFDSPANQSAGSSHELKPLTLKNLFSISVLCLCGTQFPNHSRTIQSQNTARTRFPNHLTPSCHPAQYLSFLSYQHGCSPAFR